jgi:nitronate monooxygenase
LTLLPLILANTPANGPIIIGAGGVADGSQVAALLTLGASGAVLGTRFLLSPESLYSDAQRKVLVEANSSQSVRTMAFDEARGTVGWPKGIDGRGIRNGKRTSLSIHFMISWNFL